MLHAVYNSLLHKPVFATLGILMLLPPLIYFAFEHSEKALRDWLESDLDSDVQLLEAINSGEFSDSHVGRYLHSLRDRFDGPVVADMLCYLRLHVELALRAKGVLMLKESGFDEPPMDEELKAQISELRYLERSLGRAGRTRAAADRHGHGQGPLAAAVADALSQVQAGPALRPTRLQGRAACDTACAR